MTASGNARPDASPVLVTGAFGLVGTATVRALARAGHRVVATDLDLPAHRGAAAALQRAGAASVRWADLTSPDEVTALLADVAPAAVIHLAAIIPPRCYARRELARAVNVESVATLLRAAAATPRPPRFVQASSVAVYGPRNPHRGGGLLTADTPLAPADLYGGHKAAAERLVRDSALEWVILRLGGVLTVEQSLGVDPDAIYFEATLPSDGRIQTVDVRDVARAFAAAVTTPHVRETFLIGGDATHRMTQRDIGVAVTAAMGLTGGVPQGLPGDPERDQDWFATDWMDTDRAQEILDFQRHSFPDMLAEIRARAGWRRPLLRLAAPLARAYLARRAPYRGSVEPFARPWAAMRDALGDPAPD
jgi:nucleoside-diphosphate-sugar epimerase